MDFKNFADSTAYSVTAQSYLTAKLALIATMEILGISYGLILLLWFFLVSDTFLGVLKISVIYGCRGLSKEKFVVGVLSKLAVLFIPLSLSISGALAGYDLNIFVVSTMYVLIANDATSCYTNILSIKHKKDYQNKDLIALLINTLRNTIYNLAKKAIGKIKDNGDS